MTPNSLVITGGCALNVKTNTALARGLNLPAHVPPAPGDNGIPLGAAWCPDGSLVGSWGGRRQHTVVDVVDCIVFFSELIVQKFAGCPVAEYDHLTSFGNIIPYHICMSVSVFLNGFFPQGGLNEPSASALRLLHPPAADARAAHLQGAGIQFTGAPLTGEHGKLLTPNDLETWRKCMGSSGTGMLDA